jgi:hypothetical protein
MTELGHQEISLLLYALAGNQPVNTFDAFGLNVDVLGNIWEWGTSETIPVIGGATLGLTLAFAAILTIPGDDDIDQEKDKCRRCLPCSPPVAQLMYMWLPPSRRPYVPTDHTKVFKVQEGPPKIGCRCFVQPDPPPFNHYNEGHIIPPNSIPFEYPTGGGVAP